MAESDIRLLQQFYLSCQVRDCTPKTIRFYSEGLRRLCGHAVSLDKALPDLTKGDIEGYMLLMLERVRATSLNAFLRAWRRFYNWLEEEDIMSESWANPMRRIKMLRGEKRVIPPLTGSDIVKILTASGTGFHGARNRCIVALCYDAMLRCGEMVNLLRDNIDIAGRQVRVTKSKSRNERIVPISAKSAQIFLVYQVRYLDGVPGDRFICKTDGQPLMEDRINKMMTRIGARCDIHLYPHRLRHSGATAYWKQGGSTYMLQSILGHSSQQMTRHYVQISAADAIEVHESYTPMQDVTIPKLQKRVTQSVRKKS